MDTKSTINRIARTRGDKVLDAFILGILIIVGFLAVYPIWFVCIASVSNPYFISMGQVTIIPRGLNISAYHQVFTNKSIWLGYRNSLFYLFAGTGINLVVTIPAAFALSRKTIPGRKLLMLLFIITMYFQGGMIPSYLLLRDIGILNTPLALLLPCALNVYNLIVARSFFEAGIPEDIFEAARIDGVGYTGYFFQFALPLSKAMIAVIALFYGMYHWNVYLAPMIYIQDNQYQTLQVFIQRITSSVNAALASETATSDEVRKLIEESQLLKYAVVVVSMAPMMILYPFIQRYFVGGVMIGSVKG